MTDITLLDIDFSEDPGIQTYPGSLAEGEREYDAAGHWDADFGRQASYPSWAWLDNRGPRRGFNDGDSFRMTFHHVITGYNETTWGYVGLHSDPLKGVAPDAINFMGYKIYRSIGVNYVRSYGWDNGGSPKSGPAVNLGAYLDLKVIVEYDASTRIITTTVRDWSTDTLIGTSVTTAWLSTQTIEDMTEVGTRDREDGEAAVGFLGYIDDFKMEWLDIPSDEWILYVQDSGAVIFETVRLHNKNAPPRYTINEAEGRAWSSIYWDGAGPLVVYLTGLVEADPDLIQEIEELMADAWTHGRTVELYSPITYYTLKDAKILVWDFPQDLTRPANRDFTLNIGSRRAPQIS